MVYGWVGKARPCALLDSFPCLPRPRVLLLSPHQTHGSPIPTPQTCRADVRKNIITLALAFAKRNNLPETTPVKVVKEGAEPPLFKQLFSEWEKVKIPQISSIETMSPKARQKAIVDMESLVKLSKQDDDVPVDDGNGEITIWRVENFQRVSWPRDMYGQFYSGDSYIVLYSARRRTPANPAPARHQPPTLSTTARSCSSADAQRSPAAFLPPQSTRRAAATLRSSTSGRAATPPRTRRPPRPSWPRSSTTRWAATPSRRVRGHRQRRRLTHRHSHALLSFASARGALRLSRLLRRRRRRRTAAPED